MRFIQVDGFKEEYLKLMYTYALLLAQSGEDPIVSDVQYSYDFGGFNITGEGGGGHGYDYEDGGGSRADGAENSALLSADQG
jgi:hypothetical protein